ncbi:shikimate dehydrogenase [Aminiphilus sp.]|jgi:shikimate dehydrogenase|uniref:shikimate dehydrogenase n=1 Tax=Aminiphilus sp. TaxID=1872488 RepID=UPI002601F045|nr:shikimate dehydrogenase [Aminiphilus sp.]
MTFCPTPATKYVVLFGNPLAHSLSARLHNAVFRAWEWDCLYYPLESDGAEALGRILSVLPLFHIVGANVTMPYKETVIPFLDRLDTGAAECGAVNTIVVTASGLVGHNTDGTGFLRSFKETFGESPEGKRLLVAGAGGAAKSLVFALLREGVERVVVYNNNEARAKGLVERVEAFHPGKCVWHPLEGKPVPAAAVREVDILLNTTKMGMRGAFEGSSPFDPASLRPGQFVCDAVYNPPETRLLAEAAAAGCRTLGGEGMFLHQAAEAFSLWFGRRPDVDLMRDVFRAHFRTV